MEKEKINKNKKCLKCSSDTKLVDRDDDIEKYQCNNCQFTMYVVY